MQGSFKDIILHYDHIAWFYLHYQWRHPVLDFVLPFLRNQWFWVPLYFFLALYMPNTYKKKGFIWCAGFILSFAISDRISAGIMKPYFHRLRPCHNPALADFIHMLVDCGGQYSFPSSHAANHFAIGTFAAVTLSAKYKWIWPVAMLWAASVSYAQVYVGVHYPFDVTVGGGIGLIVGALLGGIFNKYFNLFNTSAGKVQPIETV